MFITTNKVRMHDIDQAGVLYFPRQFRFTHEALEEFVESEGLSFDKLFAEEEFFFVIVHCEAQYLEPVYMGDLLEIHVSVGHIGTTSFSLLYNIYNQDGTEVGAAKTVHCTINRHDRKKIEIPERLRKILKKHLTLPPAVK